MTRWTLLKTSLLVISCLALTGACTAYTVSVRPPLCVAGPTPILNRLARCYEENCVALAVLRGDDTAQCRIQE